MSWRPHGHVRVSSRRPTAAGICDRCGRIFNHSTLRWQFDWAGAQLINKRILVCDNGCLDEPQEQLRAKILSADPLPIWNARPEPFTYTGFSYQESNILSMPSLPPGPNLDGDGFEMQMPDGLTVMLMPTFGNAIAGGLGSGKRAGDFNVDESDDYSKVGR